MIFQLQVPGQCLLVRPEAPEPEERGVSHPSTSYRSRLVTGNELVPGVALDLFWPRGGEGGDQGVTEAEGFAHAKNMLPGFCTIAFITPKYSPLWYRSTSGGTHPDAARTQLPRVRRDVRVDRGLAIQALSVGTDEPGPSGKHRLRARSVQHESSSARAATSSSSAATARS